MPSSFTFHTVAELPQFIRDCTAAGLSEDQCRAIVDAISAAPLQGDEIRGSGGVRKGPSGGSRQRQERRLRVVTAYFGKQAPVYLLALLSKGERANFTAAESAGSRKLTSEIAHHWRRRSK
jgi:hypothetical protein